MKTSPAVGISSPAIMRSTVVLPPPLGPSNAISSPSFTENVTLLTTVVSPNFFVTAFSSMLMRLSTINSCNYQPLPARLLPLHEGLDAQRKERQQRQQARHRERRRGGRLGGALIERLHPQRHGLGLPGDVAGHHRHRAELSHRPRVAENDAVDQTPLRRRQRDVPERLPPVGPQRQRCLLLLGAGRLHNGYQLAGDERKRDKHGGH